MDQGGFPEHTPQCRVQQARKPRIGALDIADGLIETQRIGNAIASEGVNYESPLIGSEDFLGRILQIEDAVVDGDDSVDNWNLHMKARLGNDPGWIAQANHQRLSGLIDSEQRPVRHDQQDRGGDYDSADKIDLHRLPPVVVGDGWVGGRLRSSGSGRYGTTPLLPCPAESRMILSVPPNRRSMVSR